MFESAWNKQLRFYFIEENDDNCCDRVHGKLHINKNADCVGPTQPNFGQSCRTKIPESCLKVHETRFHFYRRKCWFLWDRMVKIAHSFRTPWRQIFDSRPRGEMKNFESLPAHGELAVCWANSNEWLFAQQKSSGLRLATQMWSWGQCVCLTMLMTWYATSSWLSKEEQLLYKYKLQL